MRKQTSALRLVTAALAAVMLANEYLLLHAELDSDNLELVGVSFGAFLAAAPTMTCQ